jgi:CheY-like chemotaxis protein
MPEMDGIEATEVIRERFSKDIIILALSANTQSQDINACTEVGMNGFLKKPINSEILIKELDKYFLMTNPISSNGTN